ncbi:MAG: hypothetical protein IKK29_05350 [Christensenellaceae bacterium]|nr:hypothetical protein [Christensenellaceae bacterium]
MLTTALGITAFALYFLYDINSFRWKKTVPRCFFAIGSVLLLAAAAADVIGAVREKAFHSIGDPVLLIFCIISFAALIYCLFFALPFDQTYREQQTDKVCRSGAYALCRHPGILCFFGTYLFLSLAALPHKLWINGALFSLLNLAYAGFQDRVTFPKTFSDYKSYQESVPFLFPTKTSIRMARRTLTKEDDA